MASSKPTKLSSGSVFTSNGQRRSARVSVTKRTEINICDDVWNEIFDWSTRAELGLKVAPLCGRFDKLAERQLRSTRRQWTLKCIAFRRIKYRKEVAIFKDRQLKKGVLLEKSALLDILPPSNLVGFNQILINHVDQSVIAFLHRICHLFNNVDITLKLPYYGETKQLRTFVCTHLWPLIAQSVYKLTNIDQLRTFFAPAVLRDCANLRVFNEGWSFPEAPADDHANASNAQALNMWLHTPHRDGLPKMVTSSTDGITRSDFVTRMAGLKKTFVSAELPVSYIIYVKLPQLDHQEPFELENQRTRERMTFQQQPYTEYDGYIIIFLLKRGPTIWWDENKWAEIEHKAEASPGHWLDEKNLICCDTQMTFGDNFV